MVQLNHRSDLGFTLLEVVIALAIFGGVVATAVAVQDTVVRTGVRLSAGGREWTAEQFIRDQVFQIDFALTETLGVGTFTSRELSFVSRRSAQFGQHGPPVIVRYRFGASSGDLQYHEVLAPPAWPGAGHPDSFLVNWRIGRDLPQSWQGDVFTDLDRGHFAFWNPQGREWIEHWSGSGVPAAIKLRLWTLVGQHDVVMETAGSSYFSSFGS